MSQSFSFKPWTQFQKETDSIFASDFLKDRLFIFKTSHRPSRGIVKFKEMVSKNNNYYQLEEEIKLWFPLWNSGGALFVRLRKTDFKIQYEHGVRDYSGNLINFYGGFQSQKNMQNKIVKIGANLLRLTSNFDNRIRILLNQTDKPQISSAHKGNWSTGKWGFDYCAIINYHNGTLFGNAVRLIYRLDQKQQFFFKADNKNVRSIKKLDFSNVDSYFTRFAFDFIRKIDTSTKAGLEVKFAKNKILNTSIVGQKIYQKSNSKIKAKISLDKTISLSLQNKLKDYGRWIVGWELKDIGHKNQSRFGLLIDLNL